MTAFVLVFGASLMLAVLVSAYAARSPLSTTTVFLSIGLLAGPLGFDVMDVSAHAVEQAAEVALFAVLFTDGQHAPMRVFRRSWELSVRALVIGMPLTFAIVSVLAHVVAGLPWGPAFVLGAVLAPTDPVFASALVGRDDVPRRVRDVLNIESGLNDGLALPAVLVIAGTAGAHPEGWSTDPGELVLEIIIGIALGVALPLLTNALLRVPGIGSEPKLRPLGPLALAILLFGLCELTDGNPFLAAFIAGSVIATTNPSASGEFRPTGEILSEMAKGGALVAFASLVEPSVLKDAGVAAWILAAGVLLISRPIPVLLCLLGTRLPYRERFAVAWFGPKGFASVAYAVIVASSGMDHAGEILVLTTVTVLVSAFAHSSTDVTVARWWTRSSSPAG